MIQSKTAEFFARTNFITFIIKDYDSLSRNDVLGIVEVNKHEMLKGTGRRMDYTIARESEKAMAKKLRLPGVKVRSCYVNCICKNKAILLDFTGPTSMIEAYFGFAFQACHCGGNSIHGGIQFKSEVEEDWHFH